MKPVRWPHTGPLRICLALGLIVVASATWQLSPPGFVESIRALLYVAPDIPESLVFHYSWWPRLVMSLLAGGGLALAGNLMQQVLRNPLASPTTLGVASGANLALLATTLLAPGWLVAGREWVALAGGIGAMVVVFTLTWHRALAPMVVILAGLVINLYAGALSMVLLLFHQEKLKGLLIWGAGSLAQDGWQDVAFLAPRMLLSALLIWLLLRPLALLELDDASAGSLGVSFRFLRLVGLGLAVFITACVVSVVGVIGFIGLAAPNMVRLAGARRLGSRLTWSTLLGALLLAGTDLLLQHFSHALPTLIPTGATTAALGTPLLLWLIPRLRLNSEPPRDNAAPTPPHPSPRRLSLTLATTLLVSGFLALMLGQLEHGWSLTLDWQILQWRTPRLLAAAASGVMLAVAGTIIQRLTANPMASPELLGISGGCAIAVIIAIYVLSAPNNLVLVSMGTLGALVCMAVLLKINHQSGFRPEQLLLTGVAITALFDAVRTIMLAGGDPRGQQVIAWLSGSTYYVDLTSSLVVVLLACLLGLAAHFFTRWLDILPLGHATAASLGIGVKHARLALLGLVALLTATATLVVGPLSFVGLLAPHMAHMAGFQRAHWHLLGAALMGALLMVIADWLGRQWLFPDEIPAGLVASLIGGAYFMWGLRRC